MKTIYLHSYEYYPYCSLRDEKDFSEQAYEVDEETYAALYQLEANRDKAQHEFECLINSLERARKAIEEKNFNLKMNSILQLIPPEEIVTFNVESSPLSPMGTITLTPGYAILWTHIMIDNTIYVVVSTEIGHCKGVLLSTWNKYKGDN